MKKKILVVDDEINITTFLKTYLEDTGLFEVKTENTGELAFEATLEFHPDLILLDVMMKGMSGDSFADKIKSDSRTHGTKIVFLTGIVTKSEVEANGGYIGGYRYIAKPILAMQELIDCIDSELKK